MNGRRMWSFGVGIVAAAVLAVVAAASCTKEAKAPVGRPGTAAPRTATTTAAFTGINQGTAEMVIVTPEGGERYRVAGRLAVQ